MINLPKEINNSLKEKIFITEMNSGYLFLENVKGVEWFILFSKIEALNIMDLQQKDRDLFWQDIQKISKIVKQAFAPFQLNIAMLGNQLHYLHCHIIGRNKNDPFWPKPVFGEPASKMQEDQINEIVTKINNALIL